MIKYKHHNGHIKCSILIEEFDPICLTNFDSILCALNEEGEKQSDKQTNKTCEEKVKYNEIEYVSERTCSSFI